MVSANFLAIAARMSLVQFLGIYFSHRVGLDVALIGFGFLCESLARGLLAPMFGALSDRVGRRVLLLFSALGTAVILPCFLLVDGPAALLSRDVVSHKPVGRAGVVETRGWLPAGAATIGVTAGASTPDVTIGAVVERVLALRGIALPPLRSEEATEATA